MADQAGTSDAQATASRRPSERDDGGYHVFLNFRGPDTRLTVTDALHHALTHAGLRVFYDDEEIRKGEQIAGEIFSAIEHSKICITIFSRNYAFSKWCLREIAHMVDLNKKLEDGEKKVILPVFCDVDAADVKLKTKLYRKAMRKHKEESGEGVARQWKEALREVTRIKGFNLKDYGIVELAKVIKEEVLNKLNSREAVTSDSSSLFGAHGQIEAIANLLELDDSSPDAKFIVIHGMPGIGKTTIARHIFNKISSQFQGSCFLSDVRRSSSDDGVVKLQEKLLLDTLHLKCTEVSDVRDGIEKLSWRLREQRVLIVLDDLDKWDQLRKLAAESSWFAMKSRIVITTRNIDFLPKEYCFYQMKELELDHALQLFYWHAFRSSLPPPNYHDIASEIVATTGRLPLALEVIGCSLCNQDIETWKIMLEKLKKAPHEVVQECLRISYQALAKEQQEIFLDIACFFLKEEKTDPIYFWEACEFYPENGINILVQRSLIKVIDDDELWMHDQMRDLGRQIAQSETPCEKCPTLVKPSRLWDPKVALDVVQKKEGVKSIVAVQLGTLSANCIFVPEEFAGLVNLRFLQLEGGNFEGDFEGIFQKLIWLSWFDCPLEFRGTNLSFNSLVVLKLSGSHITDDWGGWHRIKAAKNLKILNLTRCPSLTRTPKFSKFLALERLILEQCDGLEEIHRSIDKLQGLKFLGISSFRAYGRPLFLPKSIGGLTSLTVLEINSGQLRKLPSSIVNLCALKHLQLLCSQLTNLPSTIGNLSSLLQLDISFSAIENLPDSIGNLINLTTLRAAESALSHLPESFGKLTSLNLLDLSDTQIIELPVTIGGLKLLNELDLSGTKITELPMTIGKLERLKILRLSFSSIEKLPKNIGDACSLEELHVEQCYDMGDKIPEEIGKLSSLRHLDLSYTPIPGLPTSISRLSHLQKLHLDTFDGDCGSFDFDVPLPKLPQSLTSLKMYHLPFYWGIVTDLSNLTNLVTLTLVTAYKKHISRPRVTTSEGEWLVKLTKLEELTLLIWDFALPPIDLSSLSRLRRLTITCFDLQHLTRLPPSLEKIILYEVKSAVEIRCPQFVGMKNVSSFNFSFCELSEIQVDALGELENLRQLWVCCSKMVEKLSGLSCLKNVKELHLSDCPKLVEIQDLEKVEMLQSLAIVSCYSVRTLPDLSNLHELVNLKFWLCRSLTSLPDVANKEKCNLSVSECPWLGEGSFYGRYHDFTRYGRPFRGRASENSGPRKRRRPRQMNRAASQLRKRRRPTVRMCRSYLFN